ncbi:hypothetical protein I7I51_02937 [Histoplasma capsulatum]|uniref:Uncharacterized protein n=1 Tax=Ajellomyces capsulatus TaxID=5037 RepID=A0A8A1MJG3_AJECA|nr:hypothetical protein I7I51_02937 [Histoplasma capsulatum]
MELEITTAALANAGASHGSWQYPDQANRFRETLAKPHYPVGLSYAVYLTSQAMLRVFCHGRHAASSRAIAVQRAVGCSDIMLSLILLSTINSRLSVDFSVDINYPQHFAFWAS